MVISFDGPVFVAGVWQLLLEFTAKANSGGGAHELPQASLARTFISIGQNLHFYWLPTHFYWPSPHSQVMAVLIHPRRAFRGAGC